MLMFKYFEPNKIFALTSRAPKYVMLLFMIIFSIGLAEALIISPEDYKQSHSVRIMYVHVPAAWITLGIFTSITFLSIIGYIFKLKNFFLISKSLAPSGAKGYAQSWNLHRLHPDSPLLAPTPITIHHPYTPHTWV